MRQGLVKRYFIHMRIFVVDMLNKVVALTQLFKVQFIDNWHIIISLEYLKVNVLYDSK